MPINLTPVSTIRMSLIIAYIKVESERNGLDVLK